MEISLNLKINKKVYKTLEQKRYYHFIRHGGLLNSLTENMYLDDEEKTHFSSRSSLERRNIGKTDKHNNFNLMMETYKTHQIHKTEARLSL